MQLGKRGTVRAEAEEHAVAERHQSGIADQQIEPQTDQRIQGDLRCDGVGQTDGVQRERQYRERRGQDGNRMQAARAHSNFSKRSPNRPLGRTSRIRIMRRYIDASAAGG